MPIRTSALVAAGMIVLSAIGVATIFGNSIAAVVAPPEMPAAHANEATVSSAATAALPPSPSDSVGAGQARSTEGRDASPAASSTASSTTSSTTSTDGSS